jgi:hypothetical protein
MVRESTDHNIAGPQSSRVESWREPPIVGLSALWIMNWPGRLEDPTEPTERDAEQATKGRLGRLQLDQAVLAGDRDASEIVHRADVLGDNAGRVELTTSGRSVGISMRHQGAKPTGLVFRPFRWAKPLSRRIELIGTVACGA